MDWSKQRQFFTVISVAALFLWVLTISIGMDYSLQIYTQTRKTVDFPNDITADIYKQKFRKYTNKTLKYYTSPTVMDSKPENISKMPIILVWSRMFGYPPFGGLSRCRMKDRCIFTEDRAYSKLADAIVFHSRDTVDRPHPRYRSENQVYIFWTLEAPHHAGEWLCPNNFFNWTMTFSPKSDVVHSYGAVKFVKLNSSVDQSLSIRRFDSFPEQLFLQKKKAIFGLISNCALGPFTKRKEIIGHIRNKYPINMAGKCAWDTKLRDFCPKKAKNCGQKVEEAINSHLFYFVLENSDCWSYVTEKTYSRLHLHSIPIASRRSIYEPLNFPPKTFIFMDDFENVEKFTNHLRYLESNKTAYMEYFRWRHEYGTISTAQDEHFCGICQKLVEKNYTSHSVENAFHEYTFCHTDSSPWNARKGHSRK